jgi:hypothetical protein
VTPRAVSTWAYAEHLCYDLACSKSRDGLRPSHTAAGVQTFRNAKNNAPLDAAIESVRLFALTMKRTESAK